MRSERELRELIAQSQEDGFRALFTQYSGYVYAIVWNRIRTVGTHEDAEETVSDVFAEVFRRFGQIEDGKLEGYLRTLAVRKAVDTFRRLAARPEQVPDEEMLWQEAVSDEDIERDHEQAALRQRLLACIHSLGEPDATIVVWKYFYGCSAEEIGKKVGLNRIAVRTRLSRAKAKLRRLLADEEL